LQRSSYFGRRNLNQENLSSLDDDSDVFTSRHGLESFGNSRFYRNSSRVSSDGLAEVGFLLFCPFFMFFCWKYLSRHGSWEFLFFLATLELKYGLFIEGLLNFTI
jgi:hypothetical protein